MTAEQPNAISSDYGVTIICRHFKQTWIHERHFILGSQNEFRPPETSGVAWMQYGIGHQDLFQFLREGWPSPIPSARWDHERERVEVFADVLFLCPECGRFHGLGHEEQDQHDAERRLWALIRHPRQPIGDSAWSRLAPSDASGLRGFAASRLRVPQFYMQQCKDQAYCERTKARGIKEFKSLMGGREQPYREEIL
jgi:hypothetical protein